MLTENTVKQNNALSVNKFTKFTNFVKSFTFYVHLSDTSQTINIHDSFANSALNIEFDIANQKLIILHRIKTLNASSKCVSVLVVKTLIKPLTVLLKSK